MQMSMYFFGVCYVGSLCINWLKYTAVNIAVNWINWYFCWCCEW